MMSGESNDGFGWKHWNVTVTEAQLVELAEWVEDRWPNARGFNRPDRVAWEFRHLPAVAVKEAAQAHFDAGNSRPPSYAELKREGARIAAARNMLDPNINDCDVRGYHGPWAIDTPMKVTVEPIPPGYREATCVGCGLVKRDTASKLKTVGEAAEAETLPEPM